MANIKSSAKRVLISRQQAARNKADKSELKTTIKKFNTALTEGNQENAEAAYKAAVKSVDRAVSKGLIHKNNAARKKSKMAVKMNSLGE
ncbi:MAG: 30S ribosomal protein S20 [Oscillospiraceae bacterium]|nr:30S ribosomal protein S20 [Oscillospiraceae bacterium]